MPVIRFLLGTALTVASFVLVPHSRAQASKPGVAKALADVKLESDGQPACLQSALENGDPDSGPSTFILKAAPGCLVAWHYHSAEEQLIVTHGDVLAEMDGMTAKPLGPGGFAMMPSKAKHQFSCKSKDACVMFVTFDRKYDIVWVKDTPPASK